MRCPTGYAWGIGRVVGDLVDGIGDDVAEAARQRIGIANANRVAALTKVTICLWFCCDGGCIGHTVWLLMIEPGWWFVSVTRRCGYCGTLPSADGLKVSSRWVDIAAWVSPVIMRRRAMSARRCIRA